MAEKRVTFAKPKEEPYGKVLRRTWTDGRFKKLSGPKPNGRDLWLYLLTMPQINLIPGLITSMGIGTLADGLEWPYEATKKCWLEIADQKMARADWPAGVIWLPKAILHNSPQNQFVVLAWRTVPLPDSPLVIEALRTIRERLTRKKSAEFVVAFDQVFVKRFPEVLEQPPLYGLGDRAGDDQGDRQQDRVGDGLQDDPQDDSMDEPEHRLGDGRGDHAGDGVGDGQSHQDQEQDQVRTPPNPPPTRGETVPEKISLKDPTRAERAEAEIIRRQFRAAELERWEASAKGVNHSAPIHQQVRDLAERGLTHDDLYQMRHCGHTPECTDPEVCIRLIVMERRRTLKGVMASAAQGSA